MALRRPARTSFPCAALVALLTLACTAAAHALGPPGDSLDRPAPGRSTAVPAGRPDARCPTGLDGSGPYAGRGLCGARVRRGSGTDRAGPDAPDAPDAPGAVRGLRAVRYSDTTGEVLWEAPEGAPDALRYALRRDGESLGIVEGRSHFESGLDAGRAYAYEVAAIDPEGRRGASERVWLGAADGRADGRADERADEEAVGADVRGGVREDASDEVRDGAPPEASDGPPFAAPDRARLVEGGGPTVVELHLARTDLDRDALRLSLVDESSGASRGLAHRFDRSGLDGGGTLVRLVLELGVATAPILPHERRFRVRVEGAGRSTDLPLAVDVAPVDADDVYLLIGQSNMQGYSRHGTKRAGPGEPDEPVERVRQLNVQPSSRQAFDAPWTFTDEGRNVSSPLFIRAEDPLHEPRGPDAAAKGGQFVGLGLTFAKSALARTTRTIYLVPAAWSATGFCADAMGDIAWNARPTPEPELGGTLLVERALTRLNMTLRETGGILRGILWHQGGADSNDEACAARYGENLRALVERLRTEARVDARGPSARGAGAPIPFVLATQSRGNDERGRFSDFGPAKRRVDAVQRDVARLVPHADFVNNDDLVPPAYPCGQTSCVHFGAEALRGIVDR